MDVAIVLTTIVLFLPLMGLFLNVLVHGSVPRRASGWIGTVPVVLAAVLAWIVALQYHQPQGWTLYRWMDTAAFSVEMGFTLDWLTVLMMVTVTTVSACVHLYSVEYMRDDPGFMRYFVYLNLFVFAMLLLVMADNLLVMFIGWEGVGVCSYLLIGFWYERESARRAGQKAFVVNRLGDVSFLLGLLLVVTVFGTFHIPTIEHRLAGGNPAWLFLIALLLFGGAVGKSAQFPLYVWLPDAMEGPSPVSSLIHAATMVTAGVYMVARLGFLYSTVRPAGYVVAVTGAITALFAASIALVHRDMKRILAFSTVSQLGFMFVAAGVGAYGVALFHLMTHAFFKGLLFLVAGSVMHALHGELDIFRMGKLAQPLPFTTTMAVVGGMGLAGIPPLAGFWSKDAILAVAGGGGTWLDWVLFGSLGTAALLTALYTFRMIFVAFWGRPGSARSDDDSLHECGLPMGLGMLILAVGTLLGGAFQYWTEGWLGGTPHGHVAHTYVVGTSLSAVLIGVLLAYFLYQRRVVAPDTLREWMSGMHRTLSRQYYVETVYRRLIVEPLHRGARVLWRVVDDLLIDGLVNLAAAVVDVTGLFVRFTQTGYLRHYLMVLAGGLVVLVWLLGLFLLP